MRNPIVKNIVYGLIVFIFMALQSSNVLAVARINPDLLLLVAILHSLYYGEFKGTLFGFGVGFLEDIFSGELFGLNAFILTLLAWLTGIYKKYIFMTDIVAFLIYVILATIVKYLLYAFFNWAFRGGESVSWMILVQLAGEIAYNALFGTLFFYLAPLLYRKAENNF